MNATDTLKLIDSRYPFGERKCWPYRVWLEVRRDLVTQPSATALGLSSTPDAVKNFWIDAEARRTVGYEKQVAKVRREREQARRERAEARRSAPTVSTKDEEASDE